MEIKITNQQQNQLLKRKEITFEVEHTQTKGTPQRLEIRNKLAEILKTQPELVYIRQVKTKTGTMRATGEANAYESIEHAKKTEPEYIVTRNTPKEKKEAAEEGKEKAEAPQPPPKKPKTTEEKPSEKTAQPPKQREE